jgi:hypothetical protein
MELAPLAFVAGILSISSPCCLPIIPGYLSYMGRVATGDGSNRRRVVGAAALFVGGFAVIFTALGGRRFFDRFLCSRCSSVVPEGRRSICDSYGPVHARRPALSLQRKESEEYAIEARATGLFKRHALLIERGCGVLVMMGVLLITAQWTRLFIPLLRLFSRTGWPPI